ncbi:NAD(P)/FAD-dependent oxidoreductase [Litoreibacter janthinus]|uniref:D-amino-acid dehydrogenase n=1 Tax=Litoreibacter janthinus TaxID=670154 RepID=A0A1I6FRE0_9RHOB|nr:FAD-dependent oxidoreductase [Litoreibacter janthinus]SFR32515.1 D-amino-acid dehydrogenase [Litoreibacter janthinus]
MGDALTNETIMVVGAGIVGVATALWLQRDGFEVTLIDREGPAAGTSYGNAGVLASGSIVPVSVPGLLTKAPSMLFSRNQPLFLKWSYLPRLLPFLRQYLAQSRSVEHIAGGLHDLLHDSVDQHHALADGTPAARFLSNEDWIYGYADREAYLADGYGWDIRRLHGVPFEEMSAGDLATYDPSLSERFGFGVRLLQHGRISDPGAYVGALMDVFCAKGGVFQKATIRDLAVEDGTCVGIETDTGVLTANQYVLTLGAWSGPLAKKLGITVPLESERGYHLEYVNPSIILKSPVMVSAGKFAMNSMDGRLRCAGVVEFGGLDAPASKAPFELLKRQVKDLFPDLTYDRVVEWMGHRPSTADSLPVIGQAPHASNVLLGYGHQHVGLTGGPKTGRWLAQLASGRAPNTDLAAYAPSRSINR